MMGLWAIVKDGSTPVEFDNEIQAIEYNDESPASIGYTYNDKIFSPPALIDEEIENQELEKISENISIKNALLNEATLRISLFQDVVDFDMATDAEKTALTLWKKYRVILSRIDANISTDITWPDKLQ